MEIKKTLVVITGLAVVVGLGVVAPQTAEAATPGVSVVSRADGQQVSWQTPALVARHAHIANKTDSTGTSSVITLADKEAPTSYVFAFVLPKGDILVPDQTGGYDVLKLDGEGAAVGVGHVDTPWAKDANGKALPTNFTQVGNVLTQHVNTAGASFPVTADPHYTWGWVSGTVYFNRQETRDIAYASGGAAGVSIFLPPPFDAIFGASFAVFAAAAAIADNHGMCLKFNTYGQFGFYSGGYCH